MINSSRCDFSAYKVRKLQEGETIKSFDCGDEDLNDFILNNANAYHEARLTETYVYEHILNGDVIAYFSLANDRISIDDFDNNTEFNRFRRHRFVNEKRIRNYPAVKICRLGINNRNIGYNQINLHIFLKIFLNKENQVSLRKGFRA